MKNIISFTLIFTIAVLQAHAQIDSTPMKRKFLPERVFVGGTMSLNVGTYTFIDVSPFAGYKITPNLWAGMGGRYMYWRDAVQKFSTNVYGGNVFVQFEIWRGIFLHAEYELLNVEDFARYPVATDRRWTEGYLGGAGYRQRLGKRTYSYLQLLWNINQNKYTPYYNPVFRAGIIF